ncbi:MAG TPA: response regulator [Methylocystis sp.]|nr:response regulator [Methylocystis sp.]
MNSSLRILYIDDDPGAARLAQKHLERSGFIVETANDGASGVARVAQGGLDAVALDHFMPKQDGLATLAAIRTLPDAPPVVYVTATNDGHVAVAALKAGAADYVFKDIGGEFLTLLATSLEQAVAKLQLHKAKNEMEAEIRIARDRFQALAVEREVLLREVNHRVGNSLQLISSILGIQEATSTAEEAKIALRQARQRVTAIGQLHKQLYTSNDVASVSLSEYLETVVGDLRRSASDRITIALRLPEETIEVTPEHALAIGVALTELILNALKHAYPLGDGAIRIELRAERSPWVSIIVEDDGPGWDMFGGVAKTGLGQTIISAMASKLEAEWGYDSEFPGTRATLRIKRSMMSKEKANSKSSSAEKAA